MLRREYRLTRGFDFQCFFRVARRREWIPFKVYVAKNDCGHARFAFVIPRSVEKGAVKRNMLRRRAREWIRKHDALLTIPHDIVLVYKKDAFQQSRNNFYESLAEAAHFF